MDHAKIFRAFWSSRKFRPRTAKELRKLVGSSGRFGSRSGIQKMIDSGAVSVERHKSPPHEAIYELTPAGIAIARKMLGVTENRPAP